MKLSADQNINMEKKVINNYKARMNYTHGKLPLIKRVANFLGKNFKKKYVYVVVIANHSKTRVEIGSDCLLGTVSKDYLSIGFLKSL